MSDLLDILGLLLMWCGLATLIGWTVYRWNMRARTVCLCLIGAQECPAHPGNTLSKEEKITFRKTWDSRYDEANSTEENS